MTRHVYFFRAVNVGGTAKLPMAELRALAEELGAAEVSTYIASGNLIGAPPGEPLAFARTLEAAVESRFGFRREVVVRDAAQLRAAVDAHPFAVENPAFSYVVFLADRPAADRIEAAREVPAGDDLWQLDGAELHLRYANGAGSAELSLDRLLRALGVAGTARNLRTVEELIRRSAA